MKVVCPDRVSESIEEQVDVPINQVVEQIVAVPAPQIRKDTGEVTQSMPQERIQEPIVDETADVPIPHMVEETIEGV